MAARDISFPKAAADRTFTTAELRKGSAYVDMVAGQIVQTVSALGKLNYWMIVDRDSDDPAQVVAVLRSRPICRPLLVDGKPFAG